MRVYKETVIVKNPEEIADKLAMGKIVISEAISKTSGHTCFNGVHVYAANKEHKLTLENNFPNWDIYLENGGLVMLFCIKNRSLKDVSRNIASAIRRNAL